MRLIDADDLFKNKIIVVKDSDSLGAIKTIMDMIKEAPTIEAEPIRHGKWINDKGLYKCSVCNEFATIAGFANCIPIEQMNKVMKYCNNCGAKMDLDEVNDEEEH